MEIYMTNEYSDSFDLDNSFELETSFLSKFLTLLGCEDITIINEDEDEADEYYIMTEEQALAYADKVSSVSHVVIHFK